MTTLITIAIILLFGLCVYIESNYRHTAHKTAREMDESTKSSECYYWGEDIIVGFFTYHKQMAICVNITLYTL